MARHINQKGIEIIRRFEGFRDSPYLCQSGVATIGFGHAIIDPETGRQLRSVAGLRKAEKLFLVPISLSDGETLLKSDIKQLETRVDTLVSADMDTDNNMFSALVSLVFNIGLSAFRKSTMLQFLLKRDFESAVPEFIKWKFSGKTVSRGLLRRRYAEVSLFTLGLSSLIED